MLNLREIHQPKTLEDALEFLKQPDTVALAGGTELIASQRRDVRAVVDLSQLGLAYVRDRDGAIAIGAMTTLAEVADSPILRAAADGVVAQAAHRSHANLLRNQATVAGALIAEPDGILAGALVALDARVMCRGAQMDDVPLRDFLPMREHFTMRGIVTEVIVPAPSLRRRAAVETVARTPRDKPIVSVCAGVELDRGFVRAAAIALGGVSETVSRATDAESRLIGNSLSDEIVARAADGALSGLQPRPDFRGSAEYRREMVKVLVARALQNIVGVN